MFAKPYRVKSNTQLKGSDKKKFKLEIRKKFPEFFAVPESDAGPDPIVDVIAPKDDITVSKIYTHTGESYLVYYQLKNPIFFEPEKERGNLHPTVYTLWKCPNLLQALSTHPPVLDKLANGADLMLPGLVVNHKLGMKAYLNGKIKKGDLLAVNLTSNVAPVAIGHAANSSEDFYMCGNRGKALIILHCYGDQLWASGTKALVPDLGKPQGLEFLEKSLSDEDNGSGSEESQNDSDQQSDEEVSESLSKVCLEGDENEDIETDDLVPENEDPVEGVGEDVIEAEHDNMDDLLEMSFLRACKLFQKKPELPILTSNFYRLHIVASCPPGKNLDMKKTTYKKLSKFLTKMQAEGIITVAEQKKGVEVISAIKFDHPKLESFRVVKYDDFPTTSNVEKSESFEPPVVTELKIVSGDVAKFFRACGFAKGDALTLIQVRDCVRDFVEKNNLQNADDPKLVNITNADLGEAVLVKGEKVTSLPWEKVSSRICSKMSNGYALSVKGFPPTVHKGKLELIELSIASRSGNKKVTLVHNLDIFKIDLQQFAHKCQVGVAASTSVHDAPNKKRPGGLPVPEVLIQGNQVLFVGKLLIDTYKIPKKYIRGLELAAKPKKGK